MFRKAKDKFPSFSEFNTLLCNDENKTRFQHLIKTELFRVANSKQLIYSCEKFVWNVSKNEILDFMCNQLEVDTITFLIHCNIKIRW